MELQHYGVKGMKWGVRKKNPSAKKQSRKYAKKQVSEYYKREKMSDEQIQSKVRKLQLENQYAQLSQQAVLYNRSIGRKALYSFIVKGNGAKALSNTGQLVNNDLTKFAVKAAVKTARRSVIGA